MSFLSAVPGMVATVVATSDARDSYELSDEVCVLFLLVFVFASFVSFVRLFKFLFRKDLYYYEVKT